MKTNHSTHLYSDTVYLGTSIPPEDTCCFEDIHRRIWT